ncbi:hypothetical protein [Mitsuaria sp. 7]|uniref:hypothetical protein n=1 Tax=Mitsuaria sp. 7 TaxID=1658665 RepID=UPI0012FB7650|nr:hypothetical protein [Mitsuaria sp. 7]
MLLIAQALLIGYLGRGVLDWVLAAHPEWGERGDQIGQALIGLFIAAVAVVPYMKLHGLIGRNRDSEKGSDEA